MKILHTSDWHIGRRLKNKDRIEEFIKFFDWLKDLITRENIDVLLVSGDIFDNTTPSVQAQNIYYSFLYSIAKSQCKHCVIISGNHDSPAFLDAPSDLLKLSNIHVIGRASQNPDDEIIKLYDPDLIVCAVPYLRDRDVRSAKLTDSFQDIDNALRTGIINHYEQIFSRAREIQENFNAPIIAMGHLFARGGLTTIDEGTRSLYVGTSVEIGSDLFSRDYIIYTALGHLHSPQFIKRENIRYSGSPIAMTFGEIDTNKSISIIELDKSNNLQIQEIPVPIFQRLERINGDSDKIFSRLRTLAKQNESVWLDITYTGNKLISEVKEILEAFSKEFPLIEILSIHDESSRALSQEKILNSFTQELDEITPLEILEMCFDENNISEDEREIFTTLYQEILQEIHEKGTND